MSDNPLKYRFVAEALDGAVLVQNAADVSAVDPQRSAFFDVAVNRLRTFSLHGPEHAVLVDLTDGHFEIDQAVFRMHEEGKVVSPFELVFFRKHRHHANVTFTVGEDGQWAHGDPQQIKHEIIFRIGWKAHDPKGEVIERVIEIE